MTSAQRMTGSYARTPSYAAQIRDGIVSRTRCGSTGPTARDADALGLDERDVVVHPALVALRVELA